MLGQRILTPSRSRAPSYDSASPPTRAYAFACADCGAHVQLDLAQLSVGETGDERLLGAEHAPAIRAHFDLNLVGKSHDGGWPQLRIAPCVACGATYVVYLGIREPSNGHVLVTVQGITQWVVNAPAIE